MLWKGSLSEDSIVPACDAVSLGVCFLKVCGILNGKEGTTILADTWYYSCSDTASHHRRTEPPAPPL